MITFNTARKRLTLLWFIQSFLLILLWITVVINAANKEAFGLWLAPHFVPVITLILTSVFSNAAVSERAVSRSKYRIALGLSIGYGLVLIFSVIMAYALGSYGQDMNGTWNTPRLLQLANSWLSILLGFLMIALGYFFTPAERAE